MGVGGRGSWPSPKREMQREAWMARRESCAEDGSSCLRRPQVPGISWQQLQSLFSL